MKPSLLPPLAIVGTFLLAACGSDPEAPPPTGDSGGAATTGGAGGAASGNGGSGGLASGGGGANTGGAAGSGGSTVGTYPGARYSTRIVSVDSANAVLRADGTLYGWGGPAPTAFGRVFKSLAPSDRTICGTLDNDQPYCLASANLDWPEESARFVQTNGSSVCIVNSTQELKCAGIPGSPELAVPSGTFKSFILGDNFGCAIPTAGALTCWGVYSSTTTAPPIPRTDFSVMSGDLHGCGIYGEGFLGCWGLNSLSTGLPSPVVAEAPTDGGYVQVVVGVRIACALKVDGTAVCWGSNEFDPPPNVKFVEISMGPTRMCGITTEGTVRCSGGSKVEENDPPEPVKVF